MDEEEVKAYIRAGEIARRVREKAERIVKPGARITDIAIELEKTILELGGRPAFPVNIGVNEIAAHYTPSDEDASTIPDGSVVKIDLGVHVDGYIADTATTVCFNTALEGLVEASRRALEEVVKIMRPGLRAREIGRTVEKIIESMGFKPIRNLSGHSIDRYLIHSGYSIPNYDDIFSTWRLGVGVYAVEPFATTGIGLVRESKDVTIYALKASRNIPEGVEGEFYNKVFDERKTLPFTTRWYPGFRDRINSILTGLRAKRLLVEYPVLIEKSGKPVSQFEHTFLILPKEVVVTTL
ncbi:type II methionyl aminopeptidase [Thermogladius sp. 4427co]|uniref:type II methionyl aminopeptidase n=1 Tax=Thermogladius sp. 4427co TaxID=3450718 RepID=UPI003F7AB2DF